MSDDVKRDDPDEIRKAVAILFADVKFGQASASKSA